MARGQIGPGLPPPEVTLPIPLAYRLAQEGTGPWLAAEFLFLRQTNPIDDQTVAIRGFVDFDGSITGAVGGFAGSRRPALDTNQVGHPEHYQPGLAIVGGWRFSSGTIIEVGWWHLADTRYSATASVLPPDYQGGATILGPNLEDTFLFSPVHSFSPDYAGPAGDLPVGNAGATFGIWNAADLMTIDFVQRFDMGFMNIRIPIDQGDCHRFYGIAGGRAIIMWERFRWRTVDFNQNGQAADTDQAIYSNVVSNRLYGATCGCAYDYFLGSSPLGGFALSAEIQGSLMVDIVKMRAKYERGDFQTAASRAINTYTLAPMVHGDFSLWWFPYEGIQCRIGYNVMAIFNTVASPKPIDFNMGGLNPNWERGRRRIYDGLHMGIGFIF
jgi:hypothetical protein